MSNSGWIGVDLDGTLAHYDGWKGVDHIGDPIPRMVERVKQWLRQGKTVKIFTARMHGHNLPVFGGPPGIKADVLTPIKRWCREHIGQELEVTNGKDFGMVELWDDRACQVVPNTGEWIGRVSSSETEELRKALAEAVSIIEHCAEAPRPSHDGPCSPGATPCDGECQAAYYYATTMQKLERMAGR